MSAKDLYHEIVKEALEKENWIITQDPYNFTIGDVNFRIDLGAEKMIAAEKGEEKIAVEIKSFLGPSLITNFYEALGQYLNYALGLKMKEPDRLLFLAVPEAVFEEFFSKPFLQAIIKEYNLKLIIFQEKTHTISQWIK
jgi:hypothetical protein